jgi:hypothetical protein
MKSKRQLLELRNKAMVDFIKVAVGFKNNEEITHEMVVNVTQASLAMIATIDFCLDDTGKTIDAIITETGKYLNELMVSDGTTYENPLIILDDESDKTGLLTRIKSIFKKK